MRWVLLVLLVACQPVPLDVTIAAYEGDLSALVYAAKSYGYFDRVGLAVTITNHTSGSQAIDSMIEGDADVATTADYALLARSFEHPDLRIFTTIAKEAGINYIVALRAAGIENQQDLAGRNIAVVPSSASEFFLMEFLELHNISATIIYLSLPEIQEGLLNGTVEAGVLWDPNAGEVMTLLEDNGIEWPVQQGRYVFFILAAREQWLADHQEEAHLMLEALIRAEDKLRSDKVEEYLQHYFGLQGEVYEQRSLSKILHTLALPQSLADNLRDEGVFIATRQNLTGDDYETLIHYQLLLDVEPERVTLIR